jgi:hypothetical protein
MIPDKSGGFSHSEISGSKSIHNSPELIAVYYVLHRLLAPRHPPNALILFTLLKLEITNDVCRVKSAQTVSTHDILVFYRGVVISFYSLLTFQTAANLLKLA